MAGTVTTWHDPVAYGTEAPWAARVDWTDPVTGEVRSAMANGRTEAEAARQAEDAADLAAARAALEDPAPRVPWVDLKREMGL